VTQSLASPHPRSDDLDRPNPAQSAQPPATPSFEPPKAIGLSLLALAIGGFGIGTTEFATMGVLPDIAGGLHTSIPSAGHLISLYALGVVVGAPLIAALGARVDRKLLLSALMAAFAVGNLASALAPSFGTLAIARFVSGLPHGAYFGVGAVTAARLAGPARRGRAFAMVMLGLTVANVAGVPLATLLGQHFGWRSVYLLVAVAGLCAMCAISLWLPRIPAAADGSMRRELGALRRPQVWFALATGAVGFGGMFAVYSYIAPTVTGVSGLAASQIWLVLTVFGLGMTIGTAVGGRLADHAVMPTLFGSFAATLAVLVAFALTAGNPWAAVTLVFLLGAVSSASVPALQTRLMDVAADGQALAAALNHSALNIANSLGAWLGGLVIAAGLGYRATGWVGAALAAGGLLVGAVSLRAGRREAPAECGGR
jgi:DHA1 family inner membrane transport protein